MVDSLLKSRHLQEASQLLKVLNNRRRLAIACLLHEHDLSVGELGEQLDLSQSALSQHLQRLREAGVVATRQEGRHIFYSLASVEARELIRTLHRLFCER